MTEGILLRDHVEIEKRRDEFARLDRINGVEKALAVLQTRFEAALERAVSGDDLKDLKREVDDHMKQTTDNIRAYFDTQTDQQSKAILSEVRGMFQQQQMQMSQDQIAQRDALLHANKTTRNELLRYGVGFALSVLGALVVFWLTK